MNEASAKSLAGTIGAELTERAQEHLRSHALVFGDPVTALFNKTRVSRVILDAAGVTSGQPFTARVHAAVELGKIAVGLLRGDPKELLADAVAHISCLAQVEGVEGKLRVERGIETGRAAISAALGGAAVRVAPGAAPPESGDMPWRDISQPQGTVIEDPEYGRLVLDGMRWIAQDGSGWLGADDVWHTTAAGEQRQDAA